MADTSSDFSDRVPGDRGYCPECGEAALGFQYANGKVGTVVRWWKDGRPDLVSVRVEDLDHDEYVLRTVSREEYEEAVERATDRNLSGPEYDQYYKALSCSACGASTDRAEIPDDID